MTRYSRDRDDALRARVRRELDWGQDGEDLISALLALAIEQAELVGTDLDAELDFQRRYRDGRDAPGWTPPTVWDRLSGDEVSP